MPLRLEFEKVADEEFAQTLVANAAVPYDHEEYERHRKMACAALLLLTDGDEDYAEALEQAFHDSNEKMAWYLRDLGWSRDDMVVRFVGR